MDYLHLSQPDTGYNPQPGWSALPNEYSDLPLDDPQHASHNIIVSQREERSFNHKFRRWYKNAAHSSALPMICLFFAGIAFAVGHHCYYSSLNHTSVSSNVSQAWALRIGTGFAFAVKCCLTTAVGIAQTQRAWFSLSKKSVSVKAIDAMFGVIGDITSFHDVEMIRKAKTATFLALVAWCLPISALVTPATLTVELKRTPQRFELVEVPTVDFNNATRFANLATCPPDSCGISPIDQIPDTYSAVQFRYPNAQTTMQSVATASTGQIQAMSPKYINSSYSISFFGPSLHCSLANATTTELIDQIDRDTQPDFGEANNGYPNTTYYCMVPGLVENGTTIAVDLSSLPTIYTEVGKKPVPMATELWIKTVDGQTKSSSVCSLYNTSFAAEFSFSNGEQLTNITNSKYLNQIRWRTGLPWPDSYRPNPAGPPFESLSFQAIWMALAQQLTGRLLFDPYSTRMFQTSIIAATEFTEYFSNEFGASVQPNITRSRPVVELVEELSRNTTLSLFSNAAFLSNVSQQANVTIDSYANYYRYSQQNLWISYGVAILLALICIAVGCKASQHSGVRATSSFSTILRTTRSEDLDRVIKDDISDKDLAKVRLEYGGQTRTETGELRRSTFRLSEPATPQQPRIRRVQSDAAAVRYA